MTENKVLDFNAVTAISESVENSNKTANTYQLSIYLNKIPKLKSSLYFDTLTYQAVLSEKVVLADENNLNFTLAKGNWSDDHTSVLKMFLEYAGVKLNRTDLDDVIQVLAKQHSINPFKKFLDGEKQNGRYNPDVYRQIMVDWLQASIDETYSVAWLKSLMKAIYHNQFFNGERLDYSPIPARFTLFGSQGIGKTLFFRELCGGLDKSINSNSDLSNKDVKSAIASSVITNFDDSAYSGKTDYVDAMKSIITQSELSYRPAYGRRDISRLNRTVFCGSTNRTYVFGDTTGNRREYALDVAVGMSNDEARKHGMDFYQETLKNGTNHQLFADLWVTFLTDDKEKNIKAIYDVNSELDKARVSAFNAHCRASDVVSDIQDFLDTKVYDTLFTAKNVDTWDVVSYLLGVDTHGGTVKKVQDCLVYTGVKKISDFDKLPGKIVNATLRRVNNSHQTLNRIQSTMYDLGGYHYKRTSAGYMYVK